MKNRANTRGTLKSCQLQQKKTEKTATGNDFERRDYFKEYSLNSMQKWVTPINYLYVNI